MHKTPKQLETLKARSRIFTEAHRKGYVTNEKAKRIGNWEQAWYHLSKMAEAGLLKQAGYNKWICARPGKRWYKQARRVLEN